MAASFGFDFDHLEVLYDLDVVVREFAETHGIGYRRVPMPNDAEEVVEALTPRVLPPAAASVPSPAARKVTGSGAPRRRRARP